MSDYKDGVYLIGDRPTNEKPKKEYTEQTNNTETENTTFIEYALNNKGNNQNKGTHELEEEEEEVTISIEHVDEAQHRNGITRRYSKNYDKYKETVEETININEDSLSRDSDDKKKGFIKNRSNKLNVEELEYIKYEQPKYEEYDEEEEEKQQASEKHEEELEEEEEEEHEEELEEEEEHNEEPIEEEEEVLEEEPVEELEEEEQEEEEERDEQEEEQYEETEEHEETEENNDFDDNNDNDLEERELSSKYEEISVQCDETSECKNESFIEQNEEIYSEHDEKIYNSNDPSVTSEFEFHFQDQISDNFQMKSKGLFKLALEKKEPFFEDIKNEKNENNKNKELTENQQKLQHTHNMTNDDKDRLIEDLRKQVVAVITKYTEESEKLEEVQKENFEMEQLFKKKYYIDIQKEKDKLNEMICENKELLKIINEYKKCFEHINQKIQHVLNTVQTCSKPKLMEQGSEMLVKNMQHILMIMDSVKQKQNVTKYDKLVEETFTPRFRSLGQGTIMLNEIRSDEPLGIKNNLYNIDRNQDYKTTNLLLSRKKNSMEYQNNDNDLVVLDNSSKKKTRNISKTSEGAKKRNISNSSKLSYSDIKTTGSKTKEKKNKKIMKSHSKENNQHLWNYSANTKQHMYNTQKNKSKMKESLNECKFNSFQNKCTLSTSSEDILNLFNKTRKFKYLLQTALNAENTGVKTTTRSLSKQNNKRYNKNERKLSEKNYISIPNKNVNIRVVPTNPNQKRTVSICLVPNEMFRKNAKNTNYTYIEKKEPVTENIRKTIGTVEKNDKNESGNIPQNSFIRNMNSSNSVFPKKVVNIELNPKINSCSNSIAITTSVLSTPKYGHVKYLLQ